MPNRQIILDFRKIHSGATLKKSSTNGQTTLIVCNENWRAINNSLILPRLATRRRRGSKSKDSKKQRVKFSILNNNSPMPKIKMEIKTVNFKIRMKSCLRKMNLSREKFRLLKTR